MAAAPFAPVRLESAIFTRQTDQDRPSQQEEAPQDAHLRPSASSESDTLGSSDGAASQNLGKAPAPADKDPKGHPAPAAFNRAADIHAGIAHAGPSTARAVNADSDPRSPSRLDADEVGEKHAFFDTHIRRESRSLIKLALVILLGLALWMWICLSIFWGSVYQLTTFLPSLNVRFVSFDTDPSAFLNGPITTQANYLASLPSSVSHLGWEVRQPADYPNGVQDVRNDVLQQKCWAAVVVNANATSAWREAIQTGDVSYDPNGAIGIYFMGARFYQVNLLYLENLIRMELMNPLTSARAAAYQSWVASTQGAGTAIAAAANVPQAVGTVFGYTIFDLRPIGNTDWSAAAPMEAALIYFVIFAFYITLFNAQARMKSGYGDRLTLGGMMRLRFGWTLFAYFFLSLWVTLVGRAFQIPLENHLGRAGFVTLWALNYVTIIAAGWALETMLSLVGVPFLPIFLILWIILNISEYSLLPYLFIGHALTAASSFYPIEMMPRFYRFLYWTPFYHNVEAFKIIAFGTNRVQRLGYHFGILFALIGVELLCYPLAMVFERWMGDRRKRKEVEEQKDKEREKGSASA